MLKLRAFLFVVGNARSGSTILGAVLDSHPNIVVANETSESSNFWRGSDREAIIAGILHNAEQQAATGRSSSGYKYQLGLPPSRKGDIQIIGDKIWNPALLLLHGDYGLIPSIEERLGVPLIVVHAVRNPYDTIATMHRRSGAPLGDRIRWYAMHCEAAEAISERLTGGSFAHVFHEDLLGSPRETIEKMCRILGVQTDGKQVAAAETLLFRTPHNTRSLVRWAPADLGAIKDLIDRFPWLQRYSNPCFQP